MRVEGDEPGGQPGDRLTVAEIQDSITTLSDVDIGRLVSTAQAFSKTCGLDAEELLQEAFTRALSGTRTCARGTAFVPFICGVMRSFASQENEARKAGFRPKILLRDGEPVLPEVPAHEPSPEAAAISAIDDRALLVAIEAAASGDEQIQLLLEGIYEGMRGDQLQELLGVDKKGLATVRTRLRRLLRVSKGEGFIMSRDHEARGKLDRLAEAVMQDILDASDIEILAEVDHGDIERARAILVEVTMNVSRRRLTSARAQHEAWTHSRREITDSFDRSTARANFEKIRRADPEFSHSVTLAARNGRPPSQSDIEGIVDDWADLKRLEGEEPLE